MANSTSSITIEVILKPLFSQALPDIIGGLDKIKAAANNLGAALSPIINKFSAFLSLAATAKLTKESIEFAEQQVQVEARLLQALSGREKSLERVKSLAKEIQKETVLNDRTILEMATNILNAGAKVEDLEVKLRAAVETGAAFEFTPEAAAGGIGFLESDALGERFSRRVAQLQKLAHEQRLAADGAKFLEERFRGAAAALASTDFGKFEQLTSRLQDIGEDLGEVFNQIRLKFLLVIEPIFVKIRDFFVAPEMGIFLQAFNSGIDGLKVGFEGTVRVLATLLGLFVVIKTGGFIAAIVGPLLSLGLFFVSILPTLAIIVAAATAVAYVFKYITDGAPGLGKLASDILDSLQKSFNTFKDIIVGIKEGKLQLSDLFLFLKIKFKEVELIFQTYVIQPIKYWFTSLKNEISSIPKLLSAEFELALTEISDTFDPFLASINSKIRKAISEIFGIPLALISHIDFIEFEPVTEEDLETLRTRLEQVRQEVKDSGQALGDEARNVIEGLQKEIHELNQKLAEELSSSFGEITARQITETANKLRELEVTYRRIRDNTTDLIEQIAAETNTIFAMENIEDVIEGSAKELLSQVRESAVDPIKQLVRGALLEQLRAGKIEYTKFYEERVELERAYTEFRAGQLDEQIASLDKEIGAEKTKLDTFKSFDAERVGANLVLQEELRVLNQRIFDIDEKRGSLLLDYIDLEKQRDAALASGSEDYENILIRLQRANEKLIALGELRNETGAKVTETEVALRDELALQQENYLEILESQGSIQDKAEKILALEQKRVKVTQDGIDSETALVEARKAIVDSLTTKVNKEFEIFQRQTSVIEKLLGEGFLSTEEAVDRLNSAYEDFNGTLIDFEEIIRTLRLESPELNEIFDELIEKIARLKEQVGEGNESKNLTFFDAIEAGFTKVQNQLGNMQLLGQAVGAELANSFNGLIDAFTRGEASGKQFFKELGRRIAVIILQALLLRAIFASLGFLGTAVYSLAAGASSSNIGGKVLKAPQNPVYIGFDPLTNGAVVKRSFGGKIPGPNYAPDRDSKLIYGTIGEWVIKRRAAQYYTDLGMEAINNMLIPREVILSSLKSKHIQPKTLDISGARQSGGPVNSTIRGGANQGYIVSSDDSVEELLKGGIGGFRRQLRKNAKQFRADLGIT